MTTGHLGNYGKLLVFKMQHKLIFCTFSFLISIFGKSVFRLFTMAEESRRRIGDKDRIIWNSWRCD